MAIDSSQEQSRGDPWFHRDPWGGDANTTGRKSATARPEDERGANYIASSQQTVNISGRYVDDWYPERSMEVVCNADQSVTVTWHGIDWSPSSGTFAKGELRIPDMKRRFGTLQGEDIVWDNGNTWKKQQGSAGTNGDAQWRASAPVAGAANTNTGSTWKDPWSTPSGSDQKADWGKSSWNQSGAADGAAQASSSVPAAASGKDAWASFDNSVRDTAQAAAEDLDQKRQVRQKMFQDYQNWYISSNALPGKSAHEQDADEIRLFSGEQATEGIDFGLYDHVPCDLSGPKHESIPTMSSFDQMFELFKEQLPDELVRNIQRCGYKHPTPVQKYAIPAAIAGRDVMCCAQTGSGKTAAFLIPTLSSMMKHHQATGKLTTPYKGPCKPDTVIMSPTRELCVQIFTEAEKFFHKTGFRAVRVYGQEAVKTQIAEIAKGADLVVATPGRLWDFVSSGIVDVTEVNCLVLDEADRMLQMALDSYMEEVITNHGMPGKENRQTMMFSATFPQECQMMASKYLYDHIYVGVGTVGGAACTISQSFIQVAPEDKYDRLLLFIDDFLEKREPGERLLVFTNSKLQAKGLDEKLFEKNVDTGALHGDLKQDEREANLEKFRKGQIDVMIATDVASRGLDIQGVSQVLNYDLPFSVDIYVQRIGRTGRIGHRGHATTFISVGKDGQWHDNTRDQIEVLKALPGKIGHDAPEWLLQKAAELSGGESSWTAAASWKGAAASSGGVGQTEWTDWRKDQNPGWGSYTATSQPHGQQQAAGAPAADSWQQPDSSQHASAPQQQQCSAEDTSAAWSSSATPVQPHGQQPAPDTWQQPAAQFASTPTPQQQGTTEGSNAAWSGSAAPSQPHGQQQAAAPAAAGTWQQPAADNWQQQWTAEDTTQQPAAAAWVPQQQAAGGDEADDPWGDSTG
mmetsp:Transcript_14910/g.42993  ORF Transcript_14910/g.42993 Transcript_14910/m.42993 type:complete len:913 (+) Transcript_14910:86-2824(+)|eukprot:CAMPEP_0176047252 /NCGR_PEP_ID=MMETSP0120_2-20121206/23467_1 /TAXON_ID=160619 /ORGANISM="Kryptoperidinium foliaceum, Strain CCMP 1326" /LENGTH=912 /DNA_ID=CAMNT_0017380667 /DNA_START=75 /DNA_END=2813 /DNA_ORIENTATION=-